MRDPNSRRLYEAAHNGDVITLQEITNRFPSLLDGGSYVVVPYERLPEPPIHVAAFFGHLDFVVKMLELEPSLAHQSDRKGLSPLHMAATNGRVNIITHLLQFDSDLCFLCDDNGRNSLHFAAMNGRLQALQLLVRQIEARPEAISFLNAKDNHGFTLLHLAAYNQHLHIIQYLLSLELMDVNALNSKGETPLDMLTNYPTVYPNLVKTANLLRGHGAICSSALNSATSPEIWARKKDALMVVASLIATMAFQATLNPPGGVWQEDTNNSNNTSVISATRQIAGKSVMATKNPSLYVLFIISASWAFMFSLTELLLHMSNTISNSGVISEILFGYAKYISTLSLVAAYFISVAFLTTLSGREALAFVVLFCITALTVILFLFFAWRHGFIRRRPSALRTLIEFPPPT